MSSSTTSNSGEEKHFNVTVKTTGQSFCAPSSIPLLLAAEHAGLEGLLMDSSCRNGTCRTCICKLAAGQVSYRIEWPGLSVDEKRDGYILPCVAYPLTDLVIELPV
ncbi:MAG: 2Fe-2S iron-sulfur cluster-binding protein [Pseudomonadota bacterium]